MTHLRQVQRFIPMYAFADFFFFALTNFFDDRKTLSQFGQKMSENAR